MEEPSRALAPGAQLALPGEHEGALRLRVQLDAAGGWLEARVRREPCDGTAQRGEDCDEALLSPGAVRTPASSAPSADAPSSVEGADSAARSEYTPSLLPTPTAAALRHAAEGRVEDGGEGEASLAELEARDRGPTPRPDISPDTSPRALAPTTLPHPRQECRAFELLRSSYDRGNFLLTKHAKVIAMTCTHAAIKRRDLVALGFQYDNLVIEEAAQIMEIETFIPMVLQNPDPATNKSRLKRVALIGDHHQLPPVVKNLAFQKYSRLDQSLFARFVRLGAPVVQLDRQGRARKEMADLYRWRYTQLGDLGTVATDPRFQKAVPGFAHPFQLVDVQDPNGVGESVPLPHYIQNLAEAEFVVATYMYMRLQVPSPLHVSRISPVHAAAGVRVTSRSRCC